MKRKILIGDDHTLIRNGLSLLINALGYTDIKTADSNNQIMKELSSQAKDNAYTHAVFDVKLTDGLIFEILSNITRLYPKLQIALFSMNPPEIYRLPCMQFGIRYYLTKTAPDLETSSMLNKFLNNDPCPIMDFNGLPSNPFSVLSEREHEVLHYLLDGMGGNQIASKLALKPPTITTLKNRIFEKTGTGNEKELFKLAFVYNII